MKIQTNKVLLFLTFLMALYVTDWKMFYEPETSLWEVAVLAERYDYFETKVDLLLYFGAEPNQMIDELGVSPIQQAVWSKNVDLVMRLAEKLTTDEKLSLCQFAIDNKRYPDKGFTEKLCKKLKTE